MVGLAFPLSVSLAFALAQADPLGAVRQLYAAADYEAALAEADRVASGGTDDHGSLELERYRALCYMALGHVEQAEAAIERVIRIDPAYEPDEQEPPRVRAAFASVRATILPGIVRATYGEAKARYDRKEYAAAAAGFERTLGILDSVESADPALSDLRTLAAGFLDLSRATIAPPPASVPVLVADTPPAPVPAPPAAQEAAPFAGSTEPRGITPPRVISQVLPPWSPAWFGAQFQSEFRGAVEVTIDENGTVISAKIVDSVHPAYDPELLEAASRWRYAPAQRNGTPVTSTKRVDIVLRPRD